MQCDEQFGCGSASSGRPATYSRPPTPRTCRVWASVRLPAWRCLGTITMATATSQHSPASTPEFAPSITYASRSIRYALGCPRIEEDLLRLLYVCPKLCVVRGPHLIMEIAMETILDFRRSVSRAAHDSYYISAGRRSGEG